MTQSIVRQLLAHWYGKLAAVVASCLALLGSIWGAYQIADGARAIYVQTVPEIGVVGSDPQLPFSLPFFVKNNSGWFDMKESKYACIVVNAQTDGVGEFSNNRFSRTIGLVKDGDTRNYSCGIAAPRNAIHGAKVIVDVSYKTLWMDRQPYEEEFNWISDRWVKGKLN
jgi:hypothetical protein